MEAELVFSWTMTFYLKKQKIFNFHLSECRDSVVELIFLLDDAGRKFLQADRLTANFFGLLLGLSNGQARTSFIWISIEQ